MCRQVGQAVHALWPGVRERYIQSSEIQSSSVSAALESMVRLLTVVGNRVFMPTLTLCVLAEAVIVLGVVLDCSQFSVVKDRRRW